MNKANSKFKSKLQFLYDSKMDAAANTFPEWVKKNRDSIISEVKKEKDLEGKSFNIDVSTKFDNYMSTVYKNEYPSEYLELFDMFELLNVYDGNKLYVFKKYELVERYLDIFCFTEPEKADVYAYFVNHTIKCLFGLDFEDVYKLKEKTFADKVYEAFKKKPKSHEVWENNFNELLKACESIRVIINFKGELQPNLNALSFKKFFDSFELEIPQDVIELILNESRRKAQAVIDTRNLEAQRREAAKEREIMNSSTISNNVSVKSDSFIINSERRAANLELKNYLIEGIPTQYIDEETLIKVLELLKIAGYLPQEINRIKKNILNNNQKLLLEMKDEIFNRAANMFLSENEISILETARKILNDPTAAKNPIYESIRVNFNFVLEQLAVFAEVKDLDDETFNDDAEMLIMCIEDITSSLEVYNYSRYVPTVKKGEN